MLEIKKLMKNYWNALESDRNNGLSKKTCQMNMRIISTDVNTITIGASIDKTKHNDIVFYIYDGKIENKEQNDNN